MQKATKPRDSPAQLIPIGYQLCRQHQLDNPQKAGNFIRMRIDSRY